MRNLNDQSYTKDNLLHLIEYEHVNQSGSNSKIENKVVSGESVNKTKSYVQRKRLRNQSNCNQKYQTGNQITRLGKQRGIEKTNQKLNVETQKQNKLKKPTASTELHPSPTPAHYQPTAHNQLAGQTPNAGSPHCQNSLDRARLAHKQASLLVHPWHTAHSTTARAAIKESSEPPCPAPKTVHAYT